MTKYLSLILLCILLLGAGFAAQDSGDLDIMKMQHHLKISQQYHQDFSLAQSYFDIFLNNDIGKAKATFLYLTNRLQQVNSNHEQLVTSFQSYQGKNMDEASKLFARETDLYFSNKKSYETMQEALSNDFVQIDQLKESAQFINMNKPIIEIVEGRLDSDNNGTPDDQELSGSNISPIGNQCY